MRLTNEGGSTSSTTALQAGREGSQGSVQPSAIVPKRGEPGVWLQQPKKHAVKAGCEHVTGPPDQPSCKPAATQLAATQPQDG